MIEVELVKGKVKVNSLCCLYKTDHIMIWEADLATKYAEILSYSSFDEVEGPIRTVSLGVTEDTLYPDTTTDFPWTDIVFYFPTFDYWSISATISKYTLTICFFKYEGVPSNDEKYYNWAKSPLDIEENCDADF